MELDPRKSRILTCVVESYIRTGEPIGSKLIAAMLETLFPLPPFAMILPTSASRAIWSSPTPQQVGSPPTAACVTTLTT